MAGCYKPMPVPLATESCYHFKIMFSKGDFVLNNSLNVTSVVVYTPWYVRDD